MLEFLPVPRRLHTLIATLGVVMAVCWVATGQAAGAVSYSDELSFELNQSSSMGLDGYPVRTDGDVNLSYSGWSPQSSPMVTEYRWTSTGPCASATMAPPCWGPGTELGHHSGFQGISSDEAMNYWSADDPGHEGSFGYWVYHPWEHEMYGKDRCVHYKLAHVEKHPDSMDHGLMGGGLPDLGAASMRSSSSGSPAPYHPPKPVDLGNCDIAISKTGPAEVALGGTATYSVTVSNVGDLAVQRQHLHLSDPSVSDTPLVFFREVTGDGDSLLEHGEVWEYRLSGGGEISLPATSCRPVTNTAKVEPVEGEDAIANNTATATTNVVGSECAPPPPLQPPPLQPPPTAELAGGPTPAPTAKIEISKLGRARARATAAIPYRIRVTNVGTVVVTDVLVSDRIPAGTALLRRPKHSIVRKGVIYWRIASLAPGRSVTVGLYLRSTGNRTRRICNIARVAAGNAPGAKARRCTRLLRIVGVSRTPVTG